MDHPEQNTIIAINNLRENYPYAASMLIFVVIERELKKYIIQHRSEELLQNKHVKIMCKNISIKDFNDKDDECFLNEFISKITLGSTEQILGINVNPPSALRNDLIHSKEYLLHESSLKESDRISINKKKFERSKKHLIEIFKKYSDYDIAEENGILLLSPKK